MAETGLLSPATVVNDTSRAGTNVNWTGPGNAVSSNNTNAVGSGLTATLGTEYLKATNFGFSIPVDATIVGIEAVVEGSSASSARATYFAEVKIVKGGAVQSTDLSGGLFLTGTADVTETFGGPTELWGETWTYSDINASTFGIAIALVGASSTAVDGRVDHITLKVYYTIGQVYNETGAAQTVLVAISGTDGKILGETGAAQTILAVVSTVDAATWDEAAAQTVLAALTAIDDATWSELGAAQTVLVTLDGADVQIHFFDEKGAEQVVLAVISASDVYIATGFYDETGGEQTLLAALTASDSLTHGELGHEQVVLAVVSATDGVTAAETGAAQTLLAVVSSTDALTLGETGHEQVILAVLSSTDALDIIEVYNETGHEELLLAVITATDTYFNFETEAGELLMLAVLTGLDTFRVATLHRVQVLNLRVIEPYSATISVG